jgi:hypothetical protein
MYFYVAAALAIAAAPQAAAQVTVTGVSGSVSAVTEIRFFGTRTPDVRVVSAPGTFQVSSTIDNLNGSMAAAEGTVVVQTGASGATISSNGKARVEFGPEVLRVDADYSGSVQVAFFITAPVSYTIIFNDNCSEDGNPGSSFACGVSLHGGGVFGDYDHNDDDPIADTLPRQGTLLPGSVVFSVGTIVSTAARDTAPHGIVTADLTASIVFGSASNTMRWINPAGGSYAVGSNWNPAIIPVHNGVRSDTAIFDLNTGSPIPINAAAATAGAWRVLNGNYNVSGPAEVFSPSFSPLSLVIADAALLSLAGSTLTSVHTAIGESPLHSIMEVINPGTTWSNAGLIKVGNGVLAVSSGGQVFTDELLIGSVTGAAGAVRARGVSGGVESFVHVTETLIIGSAGSGALEVFDGAAVQADQIDIGDTGIGSVLLNGSSNPGDPLDTSAFAALFADTIVSIGGAGQGTLTIQKGGGAQAKFVFIGASGSGTGRVIVDGQGEIAVLNALELLTIVATEQVEVEVKNGGQVQTQSLSIGSAAVRPGAADLIIRGSTTQQDPAHQSKLRVFDVPATLGPAGLTSVGGAAEGQLNILDGGQAVLEGGLVVGENARGIVVVSMPPNVSFTTESTLTVTGETRIGDGAPGFLTINGGIMNNSGDLRVGFFNGQPPSSFSVDFSEVHVQGTLAIGVFGPGVMTIKDSDPSRGVPTPECQTLLVGGTTQQGSGAVTLISSSLLVLGNAQIGVAAGYGEITIDEFSTLRINGTMTIGGPSGGSGINGTGKVIVNGTIDGAGTVVVVPNGRLEGNGTVSVPKVDAGGYIAPGLSPGTLTIDGDYEQLPGGVLVMEYTGLNPGEFDVLHVTGQTTLGGRLEVHFRNGFSPPDPGAFIHSQSFVEADQGITGDYNQRLYAFPDLFADFDDDGDKDLRDVADFQNCFGLSGPGVEPACNRADWEDNDSINEIDVLELITRLTGPQ